MSLKQSDSVLSLFSFRIPRMSRPILTSFMRSRTTKPPPQIKMSPTPGKNHFFYCSFFGGFGQEGQKRDAFYQSKADTAPHAPTVRLPRNRKEGPGARASWVGV